MISRNDKSKIVSVVIIIILFLVSIMILLFTKFNMEQLFLKNNSSQSIEIISENSKWKYMDTTVEPGVGNVWTTLKYDFSEWLDLEEYFKKEFMEDETTSTAFFRYEFDLNKIEEFYHLEGKISYKDAIIVYLNGEIVFTSNIPMGGYNSNQDMGAIKTLEEIDTKTFYITDLTNLNEGKNVISVELHRKDMESKSIYFDFEYLRLNKFEIKEELIDLSKLLILKENEEDKLSIEWNTDEMGAFKIQYIEKLKTIKEIDWNSNDVNNVMFSGERLLNGQYLNKVTLNRLKEGTNYIYRIVHLGRTLASDTYEFKTAEKKEIDFLVLGSIDSKKFNNTNEINRLYAEADKIQDIAEDIDFIILDKNIDKSNTSIEKLLFKSTIFREMPLILVDNNKKSNQIMYWSHLDMTLVQVDVTDNINQKELELINLFNNKNRKWNISILNSSKDNELNNKYINLLKSLGVDLIILKEDTYGIRNNNFEEKERESIIINRGDFANNTLETSLYKDYFYENNYGFIKIKSRASTLNISFYDIANKKIDYEINLKK